MASFPIVLSSTWDTVTKIVQQFFYAYPQVSLVSDMSLERAPKVVRDSTEFGGGGDTGLCYYEKKCYCSSGSVYK